MAADLVCPGCRTWTAERIDLRTLDLHSATLRVAARSGDAGPFDLHSATLRVAARSGDAGPFDPHGDVLACECGRRYPIVDGVPIVMQDPAGYLRGEIAAVIERDLDPEVAALLVEGGPDDAPYAHLLEHLSIYLDAQWGDRAGLACGLGAVIERLAALPDVDAAVELGCSVGRGVAELARHAKHVIGLDLQFGAVRRARRILDGEALAYARRIVGRNYTPARIAAIDRVANCTLLCADALDPPLVPGHFDRVVALNLLDSVRSPRTLLAVMDGLCARGGELILTSPYGWLSSVMTEDERIGGANPAAAVVSHLRTTGYSIEDEAELPWTLRRDARSVLTYRVHYLRARKP